MLRVGGVQAEVQFVGADIENVVVFPRSEVVPGSSEETESMRVPVGNVEDGVRVHEPPVPTRALPRGIFELFLTVTVAPGVPVPLRLILVAVVPHARVMLDTGAI